MDRVHTARDVANSTKFINWQEEDHDRFFLANKNGNEWNDPLTRLLKYIAADETRRKKWLKDLATDHVLAFGARQSDFRTFEDRLKDEANWSREYKSGMWWIQDHLFQRITRSGK